ncbi:MAG: HlyC/CorC family transporter [Firmicutes bacterium]|nr:HlyC/CorC family transporter [Bacillota bacterium]MBQ1524033.1 HlyC/CorC family transporter [Bacillota bacterium]MBQ3577427.1 HlyC/CorC family transporter [Bacillota bacterium]MBQ5437354.1 HlyC/CorC family transporter [Bacillota bacterium]MBQ6013826.1 HlyC/CorC family transporter [Bacillota bacterium]
MDDGGLSVVPRYCFLILLLLIGGAYFAAAETAFASVNRIRMISDADDGDRRAKKVLYILDHFDKALTTLLVGNNIMHISCSSAATLLASKLWGNSAVTLTTFVTAFVVFIAAEMIPKSYAKSCNEQLAPRLAGSLVFFMKLLTPVTVLFSGISSLVTALVGKGREEEPTVTEEELFDVIENIDEEDPIDEDTTELVQSALELTVTTAADIMVPWDQVEVLREGMSEAQILEILRHSQYARLPFIGRDGSIRGIIQVKNALREKLGGKQIRLSRNLLNRVSFVRPSMPADELLDYMSGRRCHMAFVRDDEGKILGLVTVEDILEELVGEIYDEEETGGDA